MSFYQKDKIPVRIIFNYGEHRDGIEMFLSIWIVDYNV